MYSVADRVMSIFWSPSIGDSAGTTSAPLQLSIRSYIYKCVRMYLNPPPPNAHINRTPSHPRSHLCNEQSVQPLAPFSCCTSWHSYYWAIKLRWRLYRNFENLFSNFARSAREVYPLHSAPKLVSHLTPLILLLPPLSLAFLNTYWVDIKSIPQAFRGRTPVWNDVVHIIGEA